jgi:hypothetical protein
MLLPRFTLRSVLLAVTCCAFIAPVIGQAVAGRPWAIATSVALCGTAAFFLVYALFYGIIRMLPFDSTSDSSIATSQATRSSE